MICARIISVRSILSTRHQSYFVHPLHRFCIRRPFPPQTSPMGRSLQGPLPVRGQICGVSPIC